MFSWRKISISSSIRLPFTFVSIEEKLSANYLDLHSRSYDTDRVKDKTAYNLLGNYILL